ncbi:DUF551 domain-containing protein [Klebsiella pneumoniae]|uniref:DUF551 domain-containing protein n=1 Tax=Klebsiella pneumoniae TaxID=573 RepID=UPI000E2D5B7E|nr:DUF551 domain-containing protein [Klebsiella pneumoniae]SXK00590.1 Protein of uncharacterised function (DUF551) [Klebsiella pneumoniae]
MSEFSRETLLNIIETDHVQCGEASALARMALAAMDSSESVELPLDYLQGHKDGLEWAARLAEANHPDTGDWLYDDPIELAKAIRKGPDMPPAQPVADSEPVIVVGDDGGDALSYRRLIQSFEPGTKLYRHAQPAPVVPDESYQQLSELYHAQEKRLFKIAQRIKGPAFDKYSHSPSQAIDVLEVAIFGDDESCRAAMLNAQPQNAPQNIPEIIPDGWIPVSERMPEVGDIVLTAMGGAVNVGEMECSAANCRFFTSVISGRELPATHWMPLPAAPQEAINALIPLVSRNEQEVK